MPCHNKQCEQHTMSESELLEATIEKLLRSRMPADIADRMGTTPACAACSCHKIASWLEELKAHKESTSFVKRITDIFSR